MIVISFYWLAAREARGLLLSALLLCVYLLYSKHFIFTESCVSDFSMMMDLLFFMTVMWILLYIPWNAFVIIVHGVVNGYFWFLLSRIENAVKLWSAKQPSIVQYALFSKLTTCNLTAIFTARLYASAVYAMAHWPCVCVFVCLSQVSFMLKRLNGLRWFFAWRLPSTYLTLCFKETTQCKEIHVTPEIRVLCPKLWT